MQFVLQLLASFAGKRSTQKQYRTLNSSDFLLPNFQGTFNDLCREVGDLSEYFEHFSQENLVRLSFVYGSLVCEY